MIYIAILLCLYILVLNIKWEKIQIYKISKAQKPTELFCESMKSSIITAKGNNIPIKIRFNKLDSSFCLSKSLFIFS